jgi:hypothetical protein
MHQMDANGFMSRNDETVPFLLKHVLVMQVDMVRSRYGSAAQMVTPPNTMHTPRLY